MAAPSAGRVISEHRYGDPASGRNWGDAWDVDLQPLTTGQTQGPRVTVHDAFGPWLHINHKRVDQPIVVGKTKE
jgi:hypothetical protein